MGPARSAAVHRQHHRLLGAEAHAAAQQHHVDLVDRFQPAWRPCHTATPYSVSALFSPSVRWEVGSGSTRLNPQPIARAPPSASSLSPTITACAASTPSRDSAVWNIAASGLTAPTSKDSTNSPTQSATPSVTKAGRTSNAIFDTTAVLMPCRCRPLSTSAVSGYGVQDDGSITRS